MSNNYGIKVSRPSFDVFTAAPNQLSFNSEYKTLKVHTSGSGNITTSGRTITIPHNLGYVPFFMVHSTLLDAFDNTKYFLTPAGAGAGAPNNNDIISYADSGNLYIKAEDNVGVLSAYPSVSTDMGVKGDFSWTTGGADIGVEGSGTGYISGIRTTSVTVSQGVTILSASLYFYANTVHPTANETIKMTIVGFAEDNTATFSSDPTGRPTTSSSYNYTINVVQGQYFSIDVTNIVQEIINRSGWSSGNAIGFKIIDNGTINPGGFGRYTEDDYSASHNVDPYLFIQKSSVIANYKYTIFKNQIA